MRTEATLEKSSFPRTREFKGLSSMDVPVRGHDVGGVVRRRPGVRSERNPALRTLSRCGSAFLLAGLVFVAGCGKEPLLEGRVEFRQVNLATKYAGRLHKLHVEEGQRVEANALVAEIVSPEVEAKRLQADAQVAAAKAQQRKADDGARQQEIASARAGVASAQAQAELARTTEGRMQRLFKEGVVPRQRLDQATAARRSADAALVAAQSTLSMAQEGARREDRDAAAAATAGAEGLRQEVQAAVAETQVRAPSPGDIVNVLSHEGEIVAAGFPIAVLALSDAPWVSFNLREDLLAGLKVGQRFEARIPALGKEGTVELEVERIAVLGDYATWRSTRDLGSYDLRSFEVRAHPVAPVAGLRAGMSVLVSQAQLRNAR